MKNSLRPEVKFLFVNFPQSKDKLRIICFVVPQGYWKMKASRIEESDPNFSKCLGTRFGNQTGHLKHILWPNLTS